EGTVVMGFRSGNKSAPSAFFLRHEPTRAMAPDTSGGSMSQPDVRKGMPSRGLDRPTFEKRFKSAFVDPVFSPLQRELQAITDAAWDAYDDSRKAPITRKAGPGFADPDYDIAVDWLPRAMPSTPPNVFTMIRRVRRASSSSMAR